MAKRTFAFADPVRRHLDMVYSAALRRVDGDAHLAQNATQGVFADLASKAPALARRPQLTGWFQTGTRCATAQVVHAGRRRTREQEATPCTAHGRLPVHRPFGTVCAR